MKCIKCGNEVEIGEVFCQRCGTAIQIVPDYNPLEDELENSLESDTLIEEEEKNTQENEQKKPKAKKQKKQILIVTLLCFCLIGGIVSGGVLYSNYKKQHSFSYQYQQGLFYQARKEYETAITYYTQAMIYDKMNVDVRLRAAEVYQELDDDNRALELLLEVVNLQPTIENYRFLMETSEACGNTELMKKVLKDTQGTVIGEALSDYKAVSVRVNLAGGEYHEYLTLELEPSEKNAIIYYTIDGTAPLKNSTIYTKPIELEEAGSFILRAVAYNEADLAGEELKETYEITLLKPDIPNILPQSGTYVYNEKIVLEIQEGATAYFTIDGTTPSKGNGYIYTEPIMMPIGNIIFSSIVIDRYGMVSDVAKRNYTCTIDRPFGYDAAVIKLKNYLVEIGMMSDLNGSRADDERISVEFVSLTEIDGQECYVFTLRRTASNTTTTLNDKRYAVTTQAGEVYTLTREMEGIYHFVVEEKEEETTEEETTIQETDEQEILE